MTFVGSGLCSSFLDGIALACDIESFRSLGLHEAYSVGALITKAIFDDPGQIERLAISPFALGFAQVAFSLQMVRYWKRTISQWEWLSRPSIAPGFLGSLRWYFYSGIWTLNHIPIAIQCEYYPERRVNGLSPTSIGHILRDAFLTWNFHGAFRACMTQLLYSHSFRNWRVPFPFAFFFKASMISCFGAITGCHLSDLYKPPIVCQSN
jgi:hypothetical protein